MDADKRKPLCVEDLITLSCSELNAQTHGGSSVLSANCAAFIL